MFLMQCYGAGVGGVEPKLFGVQEPEQEINFI